MLGFLLHSILAGSIAAVAFSQGISTVAAAASDPATNQASDSGQQPAVQKMIADAEREVCQQLKDCDGAQFRNGHIVTYQGRSVICGEVASRNSGLGDSNYEIWIKLIGSTMPPILETFYPPSGRSLIHEGPCAKPSPNAAPQ